MYVYINRNVLHCWHLESFFFFFLSFFFFFFSLDDADELEFTSFALAFRFYVRHSSTPRWVCRPLSLHWPNANYSSFYLACRNNELFNSNVRNFNGGKPIKVWQTQLWFLGTASGNGDGRNGLVVRCGLHTFYCILHGRQHQPIAVALVSMEF